MSALPDKIGSNIVINQHFNGRGKVVLIDKIITIRPMAFRWCQWQQELQRETVIPLNYTQC